MRRSNGLKAVLCLEVELPSELGTKLPPEKLRLFNVVDKSKRPIQSNGSQLKAVMVEPQVAIKHFPSWSKSMFLIGASSGKLCETHSVVSTSKNRITLSSELAASKYSTGLNRTFRTLSDFKII